MKSRFSFSPVIAGFAGALIGSTSMMMFSAVYPANGTAQRGSPAIASAAEISSVGSTDQQRIVDAVKRVRPSVVSLLVTVNGTRTEAAEPFGQMFGGQNGPSAPQK